MTTLTTPDLNVLRLPRDEDGPVFAEPWQAQAFALALQLHEQGAFTWTEWAAALSEHHAERCQISQTTTCGPDTIWLEE